MYFQKKLWVFVSDAKLWGKNQKNIALFYNYVALICEIASMEVWLALRVGVQPRRQYRVTGAVTALRLILPAMQLLCRGVSRKWRVWVSHRLIRLIRFICANLRFQREPAGCNEYVRPVGQVMTRREMATMSQNAYFLYRLVYRLVIFSKKCS